MALFRRDILQNAEKLVSKGKIEAAIREFKKVLAEDPEDANTLNRIGDLLVRLQRNDEAADYYGQTAERFASDGFYLKAIAVYKKVQRLQPARGTLIRRLAELYEKQGLTSDARAHYLQYAEMAIRDGELRFAVDVFERLVGLEPEDPTHRLRLADLYRRRDQLDRAVTTYVEIAHMMIDHGRVDHARQVFERAIEIVPADVELARKAVTALVAAGGAQMGRRLIETAAKQNPAIGDLIDLLTSAPRAPTTPRKEPSGELELHFSDTGAQQVDLEARARELADATLDLGGAGEEELLADLEGLELEEASAVPFATPRARRSVPASGTEQREPPAERAQPSPQPPPKERTQERPVIDTSQEFELIVDLDDVEEEAPATLVQPPPDIGDEIGFGAMRTTHTGELAAAPKAVPEREASPPSQAAVPAPPPADPIVRPLPQQHAPSPGDRFALELEPEPEPEAQVSEPVLSESDRHTRITDLLSEADVFFKYGLYQKSRERLGELLGLDPRYIAAHVRLVRLALEEGDENRVLATVLQAQSLADELADLEASAEIQGALEQAGYRVDEGQLIAEATGVHPRLTAEPPRPVAKSARSTAETSARLAPPAPPPQKLGATPEVEPLSKADWLDDILPPAAGASSEGQLFEEEGQFFDLAAELQDDLAEELDRILPAAEPSLEDIVEGFKKGVAENISQEDSDTHYNLGIAYREMLLVDEAIGEFQISARSADYLVESSAMLALCYRDKGMPDLAAKWYQKALASGLAGVEQRLGMLYELGSIHEQLQDREAAYSAYLEVYSANENFRDIAEKVQQFQPAERRT